MMALLAWWLLLTSLATTLHLSHGYVIPTGQFCPHRSDAWYQYMDHLDAVSQAHHDFSQSINAQNQKQVPKKQLNVFLSEWDRLSQFRQTCSDYQLSEYLTEPHIFHHQLAQLEEGWVPLCQRLAKKKTLGFWSCFELKRKLPSTLNQLPPEISAPPFLPVVFETQSREVQLETLQLLDDHKELIENGANFGRFSSEKRQDYLDKLRRVEERWEIAFQRLQMLKGLNPEYLSQCTAWLADLGLEEDHYKKLHRDNLELSSNNSNSDNAKQQRRSILAMGRSCFHRLRNIVWKISFPRRKETPKEEAGVEEAWA